MRGEGVAREDDSVKDQVPRFCARCRRDADGGEDLCGVCGDPIRDQGYCPVCEGFWRRPVGADCPKHDIPLEDPPPAEEFDPAWGPLTSWVTVATFTDLPAAEPARLRLEAEGVPTFLEGARMGGRSMYLVATGGVKLRVPGPLAPDARVLLSQTWAPPATADDLDDAWEDLAPVPGARRRSVMKGVILLLLFGPLLLGVLAWLTGQVFRLGPGR